MVLEEEICKRKLQKSWVEARWEVLFIRTKVLSSVCLFAFWHWAGVCSMKSNWISSQWPPVIEHYRAEEWSSHMRLEHLAEGMPHSKPCSSSQELSQISERRGWLLIIPSVGYKVQLTWTNYSEWSASHRISLFSENNWKKAFKVLLVE